MESLNKARQLQHALSKLREIAMEIDAPIIQVLGMCSRPEEKDDYVFRTYPRPSVPDEQFNIRIVKRREIRNGKPFICFDYVLLRTLDHKMEIVDEADSKLHQSNRGLCIPVKSSTDVP